MSNTWDVDFDDRELQRLLKDAGNQADELVAQALQIVAEDLQSAVVEMFETSGHGKWPPNKPSTIAKKGSSKPMIDTGAMMGSIRAESGPDYAMAATDKEYVVFHLEGGDVIPRRNPFDIPDGFDQDAAKTVADYVAQALIPA